MARKRDQDEIANWRALALGRDDRAREERLREDGARSPSENLERAPVSGSTLDPPALLRALHQAGVAHLVLGDFAVIAYGVVRTTTELDICPDPARENLEALARFLRDTHAVNLETEDDSPIAMPFDPTDPDDLALGSNYRLQTPDGVLHVRQWVPGIPGAHAYATLAPDAVGAEVGGTPIRICSLTHLRRMKRTSGNLRDIQDLADLDSARGERG